jgi:uncharacterized small protein (DUF1192 family)
MDAWWEEPDALGYALSPLSDIEIRKKFASEIDRLKSEYKAKKGNKSTDKDELIEK